MIVSEIPLSNLTFKKKVLKLEGKSILLFKVRHFTSIILHYDVLIVHDCSTGLPAN